MKLFNRVVKEGSAMKAIVALVVPASILLLACAGQLRDATTDAGMNAAAAGRAVRPARFPADRPYSYGVRAGETLYITAQPGRDPVTGATPDGIAAQTRLAMGNIGEILEAAALDHSHLVKCHVYLQSMDDYAGMNQVYRSFFSGRIPARTTVEAAGLLHASRIELACIAFRDRTRISVVTPPAGSLPAPLGPYSAAVWAGDTLYLSGMGGEFPENRRLPEPFAEQATQTLANIQTTLTAAGLGLDDVVSSNAYLTVKEGSRELAAAYRAAFEKSSQPPQGLIFLPRLPGGSKVEVTFIAARGGRRQLIGAPDRSNERSPRGSRVQGTLYSRTESAPDAGPAFDAQFREVLRRLRGTVEAAGMRWTDVAHVQIYLTDPSDMDSMNSIFREAFTGGLPARTAVQVQSSEGTLVSAALVAAAGS